MRTSVLIAALASAAAFAATPSQTTTYVDGNVAGLSPNTGGTLSFDDDKAMYLHTGLTNVAVPYAGIDNAELGAVKENSHDVPFYKFWDRLKPRKTETQLLVVTFKNEQGENKSMTLELGQEGAQSVLADLQSHTGKNFSAHPSAAEAKAPAPKKVDPMAKSAADKANDNWWGDQIWKTERNADKFPKNSSNDQR